MGWSRSCSWFVVVLVIVSSGSVFGPGKHHVLWHLCDYHILITLESLHERRHSFIASRYVRRQWQSFCWYPKPSQATLTSFARLIAIHLIIHLKLFILCFHQLIVYGTAQLNQKKTFSYWVNKSRFKVLEIKGSFLPSIRLILQSLKRQ